MGNGVALAEEVGVAVAGTAVVAFDCCVGVTGEDCAPVAVVTDVVLAVTLSGEAELAETFGNTI